MPDSKPRPVSTSTTSSLMQDVPGAFPTGPQFGPEDTEDGEAEVTYQSLHQIVHARRAEYLRTKHVRIKIGSWNVAAFKGAEKDVGGWFVGGKGISAGVSGLDIKDDDLPRESVTEQEERYQYKKETIPKGDNGAVPGGEDVGLYVLGLQEVVDVGSATEAFRPYTDPSVANRWKDAMTAALPNGYRLVGEQQLIGMLLLIYAAPNVAEEIKSVSTTSVGTGLMGYMGNKGAVTARLVLGDTTRLVFINSHMAAGADKAALDRRNWDAQEIVQRTRFEPIKDAMDLAQSTGEQIGDEDFTFWFGDLNYRLEGIPGDDVRRILMLHTRNEYDISQRSARKLDEQLQDATNSVKERVEGGDSAVSSPVGANGHALPPTLVDDIKPDEDPTSLQTTLSSLLPHDELHQQMNARKAFHDGWREGPIRFLPTYKYDAGTVGVFDSSEKKRAPSWCDRILYRTRRDRLAYEAKVREEENARKKDAEFKANGIDQGANDEEILYDYDPETDGAENADDYNEYDEYDDAEDGVVITKEGFEDEIQLEYYTAHQRVLSSDHKPLDASFMLKYEAVVPELKAKVHAEVAKELDKAENEGRPNVTVVVDRHNDTPAATEGASEEKFEGVWFGDVRWAQTKHRSLTVANTSRVPASFTFIERPVGDGQSTGMAPSWLTIKLNGNIMDSSKPESDNVTLDPGESCNIELELRIMSIDNVKDLNKTKLGLEDILVLRVENGRDHFIPVRGNWLESSLGRSIDKLVRIPEGGIRKLQRQRPEGKLKAAANAATAAKAMQDQPRPSFEENEEPVRFSAPRELFRLTEAVEELATRVVAEWEMIHAPTTPVEAAFSPTEESSTAPWDEHPAWPFDERCWNEKGRSHWDTALSEACNALDEDTAIESALPDDLPRVQKLYVLSSLLLLFLHSMPDGIVTADLWMAVEKYLVDNEKAKRKASIDDQTTAIQEILSREPSHNITFILITGMLERMLQERAANEAAPWQPGHSRTTSTTSSIEPPMSPTKRAGGTLKRMVTGKGAPKQEKGQAATELARVFADAIIRAPAVSGDKAKATQQKRKQELIEVFLRRDEAG